jgi:hypothetical protein
MDLLCFWNNSRLVRFPAMEIVQRQDDIDSALRLPSILLESLLKKRRQEERQERSNVEEAERIRHRRTRELGQRVKVVGKRRRRRWDNGMFEPAQSFRFGGVDPSPRWLRHRANGLRCSLFRSRCHLVWSLSIRGQAGVVPLVPDIADPCSFRLLLPILCHLYHSQLLQQLARSSPRTIRPRSPTHQTLPPHVSPSATRRLPFIRSRRTSLYRRRRPTRRKKCRRSRCGKVFALHQGSEESDSKGCRVRAWTGWSSRGGRRARRERGRRMAEGRSDHPRSRRSCSKPRRFPISPFFFFFLSTAHASGPRLDPRGGD